VGKKLGSRHRFADVERLNRSSGTKEDIEEVQKAKAKFHSSKAQVCKTNTHGFPDPRRRMIVTSGRLFQPYAEDLTRSPWRLLKRCSSHCS
jgi:hypothetical protein